MARSHTVKIGGRNYDVMYWVVRMQDGDEITLDFGFDRCPLDCLRWDYYEWQYYHPGQSAWKDIIKEPKMGSREARWKIPCWDRQGYFKITRVATLLNGFCRCGEPVHDPGDECEECWRDIIANPGPDEDLVYG